MTIPNQVNDITKDITRDLAWIAQIHVDQKGRYEECERLGRLLASAVGNYQDALQRGFNYEQTMTLRQRMGEAAQAWWVSSAANFLPESIDEQVLHGNPDEHLGQHFAQPLAEPVKDKGGYLPMDELRAMATALVDNGYAQRPAAADEIGSRGANDVLTQFKELIDQHVAPRAPLGRVVVETDDAMIASIEDCAGQCSHESNCPVVNYADSWTLGKRMQSRHGTRKVTIDGR